MTVRARRSAGRYRPGKQFLPRRPGISPRCGDNIGPSLGRPWVGAARPLAAPGPTR